ncbi:uncharacterized protein LOC104887825 [Beta vulgaris subsp. vulgaris]|uniref:uncharacterized protein LOC104887825 n=1 Tax=Beta vulgaris subsp. vulgaris TaxID=3555 RepID=UPI0005400F35|nr:uncharacterized protein LOC104887825 [Beta vulgaris subsp. vulgaris]
MSGEQVKNMILLRVGWWIKGWNVQFPYSPDEISRNPQCLRWVESKAKRTLLPLDPSASIWSPPPENWLKWNVDASLHPHLMRTSIGGVLRDHNGKFICLFSSPIPFMEINTAEIFAIHKAMKICKDFNHLHGKKFIVESDSKNAVAWCKEKFGGPWNIQFILNYIRNISSPELQFEICHRGRSSNSVSDGLAKLGLSRQDDFLAWLELLEDRFCNLD